MSELPGIFKIRASYKPTAEVDTFVGEHGLLFYNEQDRKLRISDGETPGGIIINSDAVSNIVGFTIDEINQVVYLNGDWNFLPTDADSQSLGSADNFWKDLYISDGTIYFGPSGLKIEIDPSTNSISLPDNTVLRNDASGTVRPIASSTDITTLQNSITNLSNTVDNLVTGSPVATDEIPLNGTEYTLLFDDYDINDLLNYLVLDDNNQMVEVVSTLEEDRLILQSNINLSNHIIKVVYQ